jgi:enoyl-CoA hydratase/carnithine racemase
VSKAIDLLQKVNLTIYSSKKIFLAAINGFAMGPGFELALACDLILASDSAWMSLPQASRGMVTDAGGLSFLKLKGISEFFINEILMTGKKYESLELKNIHEDGGYSTFIKYRSYYF